MSAHQTIDDAQVAEFWRQGYLLVPQMAAPDFCSDVRSAALRQLSERIAPFELEAQVAYPGAPTQGQSGDETIRRLLGAYQRGAPYSTWAHNQLLVNTLARLFDGNQVWLSPNHHNCVMTKQPEYSSLTGWHRDIRYWSFNNSDLITAWLALGEEQENNGSLKVIPGSHRANLERDAFDDALFFREDLAKNQALIETQQRITMQPGDCLLFHAGLLHAAGRNLRHDPKLALVFTFHGDQTRPNPGTRSARAEEIVIL